MNAQYLIEFNRGDQLLKSIPELTGVGYDFNNFKVAPREEVAITKAAIAGRVGHGSDQHQKWVKALAQRLMERRGEFSSYKKALQPAISHIKGLERLERFALEL